MLDGAEVLAEAVLARAGGARRLISRRLGALAPRPHGPGRADHPAAGVLELAEGGTAAGSSSTKRSGSPGASAGPGRGVHQWHPRPGRARPRAPVNILARQLAGPAKTRRRAVRRSICSRSSAGWRPAGIESGWSAPAGRAPARREAGRRTSRSPGRGGRHQLHAGRAAARSGRPSPRSVRTYWSRTSTSCRSIAPGSPTSPPA